MPVRSATEALPAGWLRGDISVIGLARSGRAVAELLHRAGAAVYASDAGQGDAARVAAEALGELGAHATVGSHDLARIAASALVVASPGVPPDAAPLRAARDAGVAIVSEIEIALQFLPHQRMIGITGTNGKTTTTALVQALLTALGHDAVAAGNIGTPLSEVALRAVAPDWIALELSSFQLHDTPSIAPAAGILTNLSANHLDRYDSVEEYFGDKALLFRNASADSVWVGNADDAAVVAMLDGVAGEQRRFSLHESTDGWYDRDGGMLVLDGEPLLERHTLGLLGEHNVANALAAALAVTGVSPLHRTRAARESIARALQEFSALEHRIEPAGEFHDVLWINDSKSTNVASTLVALRGMSRPTVVLLGGRHKGEPYTALADELRRIARAVVAYGEAGTQVASDLTDVVTVEHVAGDFDAVMVRARALAKPGDAVLLSPACSSYDMFENYEQRGRAFKALASRE